MHALRQLWLLLLLAAAALGAAAQPLVAVPPLSERVIDLTGTLTAVEQQFLVNNLAPSVGAPALLSPTGPLKIGQLITVTVPVICACSSRSARRESSKRTAPTSKRIAGPLSLGAAPLPFARCCRELASIRRS